MTVTVTRPNGKVYKSRKPPASIVFDPDSWDSQVGDGTCAVLVIRTDDYDYAKKVAYSRLLTEHDRDCAEGMKDGHFGWWRESMRDNAPYWTADEVRGVPGFLFESPW